MFEDLVELRIGDLDVRDVELAEVVDERVVLASVGKLHRAVDDLEIDHLVRREARFVDRFRQVDPHPLAASLEERIDILEGDQFALANDTDAVTDSLHFAQHVRRKDRLPGVTFPLEELMESILFERIEPGRRLV